MIRDAGEYACVVKVRTGDEDTEVVRRAGYIHVMPRPERKNKQPKIEEIIDDAGYDDDYLDPDDREVTQEMMDRNISCATLEETMNLSNTSEPYLCFDMKKKMTHYIAKPAGSTVQIFCTAKGKRAVNNSCLQLLVISRSSVVTGILFTGKPTPSIKWFKDDAPFVQYGYQHKILKNAIQIQDSVPKDSGFYRCVASNEFKNISYETEYVVIRKSEKYHQSVVCRFRDAL